MYIFPRLKIERDARSVITFQRFKLTHLTVALFFSSVLLEEILV